MPFETARIIETPADVPSERANIPAISNILSHSQLFHGMPINNLQDLVFQTTIIRGARDSQLLSDHQMNARVPGLFVVLEGAVKLEFWKMDLGRGNFFGEAALFEIPLAAIETTGPVRTLEPSTCLLITRDQLIAWFTHHPTLEGPFYRHLAAALCHRAYFNNRELAKAG